MEILRTRLIDTLEALVASAGVSSGSTVLIEAPAGGGKTTLVTQWQKRTRVGAFLVTRSDHLDTPIAFAPLISIASQLDPALERALISGDRPEALRRLIRVVERSPRPTVVVIEDAHLLDQPTAEFVVVLAGRTARLPLVLTLTHRSERSDHGPAFTDLLLRLPSGSTAAIEVPPLNVEEVAHMVGSGVDPDEIMRETGGLPLLVAESASPGGAGRDLRLLVLSRFDRLSPDGQSALALIACAPEGLETSILDSARPGWEPEVEPAEESGLVVLEGAHVRFRHELYRSIVHDDMTAIRRRFVHEQILEHLPRHAPPARRAVHAAASGNVEALIANGPLAAAEAQRLGAHREAVAHLERTLDFAYSIEPRTRLELFGALARSAWAIGEVSTARGAITTALELALEIGAPRGHDLVHAARIAWFTGDGARAETLVDHAIDDLRESDDPAGLASALGYRSLLAGIRDSLAAARPFIDGALETLQRLSHDHQVSAQVLNDIGMVEHLYDADESTLAHAAEIAEREDVPLELVRSHVNRAFGAMVRHDHRTARPSLRRATTVSDELQVRAFEGVTSLVEAQLAFDQGRWDDAADLLASIEEIGAEAGFSRTTGRLLRARMAVRRGEFDAPERSVAALRLGLDDGEPERTTLAVSLVAEERWLKGVEPAIGAFDIARSLAERSGHPWWVEEVEFWTSRFEEVTPPDPCRTPYGTAIADPTAAAAEFEAHGMVYERLLMDVISGGAPAMLSALPALDELGARALAAVTRRRLEDSGVAGIPRGPNRATRSNPAGLTRRQLDVLWLVVDRLTNVEIAERLYLSTRTVDHHVAAILQKLKVGSRREVEACAAELGLVRS